MRTVAPRVLWVGLVSIGCSSTPDAGSTLPDASLTGSGGSSNDGGGKHAPPPRETGPSPVVDAGPPPCEGKTIRCNGVCIGTDSPTAGNCQLFSQLDGVTALAVASTGDVYAATHFGTASIWHIPPAGGTGTPLASDSVDIQALIVDDTNVYFETRSETSKNYPRITGSIGQVPRQGGASRMLVRDIPDGVFAKTANYFYVGAQQISTGIRRFDLDGSHQTLLTSVNVQDFDMGADEIFLLEDTYQPIQRLSLGGTADAGIADAGAALPALGTDRCQQILGVDTEYVYAWCRDFVRIRIADGTSTVIATSLGYGGTQALLQGTYIYRIHHEGYLSPSVIDRIPLAGGAPQRMATVDGTQFVLYAAATETALYVFADQGYNIMPFPGFILKITPPN